MSDKNINIEDLDREVEEWICENHREFKTCWTGTIIRKYTPEEKEKVIHYIALKRPVIFANLCERGFISPTDMMILAEKRPNLICNAPEEFLSSDAFIQELKKSPNSEIYDYLPKNVRSNPEIMQLCNRSSKLYYADGYDVNGYDWNWENKNGQLISFFKLFGNFPITSKEDYMAIAEVYLESDISVPEFCRIYGISSPEGMHQLLSRIKKESLQAKQEIESQMQNTQTKFKERQRHIAEQLKNGEITIEEYFNDHYRASDSIDLITYYLKPEERTKVLKELSDYIVSNKETLPMQKVSTLIRNDGSISDLAQTYIKYMKQNSYGNKDIIKAAYQCVPIIRNYEKPYRRNNTYMSYIINGETKNIDDAVIDQAISYIDDHDIYLCQYTANNICRRIIKGQLDYKAQTEEKMTTMRESIMTLLREKKTIKDYMDTMKADSEKVA